MKKLFIATTAFSSLLLISSAMAQVLTTITFTCPVTSGDPANQLRNYNNNYIAGNGLESVNSGKGPIMTYVTFKTTAPLKGMPDNFMTYSNMSTNFNNSDFANAIISCVYKSPHYNTFAVEYQLPNAASGAVLVSSTSNQVTLAVPAGFKI